MFKITLTQLTNLLEIFKFKMKIILTYITYPIRYLSSFLRLDLSGYDEKHLSSIFVKSNRFKLGVLLGLFLLISIIFPYKACFIILVSIYIFIKKTNHIKIPSTSQSIYLTPGILGLLVFVPTTVNTVCNSITDTPISFLITIPATTLVALGIIKLSLITEVTSVGSSSNEVISTGNIVNPEDVQIALEHSKVVAAQQPIFTIPNNFFTLEKGTLNCILTTNTEYMVGTSLIQSSITGVETSLALKDNIDSSTPNPVEIVSSSEMAPVNKEEIAQDSNHEIPHFVDRISKTNTALGKTPLITPTTTDILSIKSSMANINIVETKVIPSIEQLNIKKPLILEPMPILESITEVENSFNNKKVFSEVFKSISVNNEAIIEVSNIMATEDTPTKNPINISTASDTLNISNSSLKAIVPTIATDIYEIKSSNIINQSKILEAPRVEPLAVNTSNLNLSIKKPLILEPMIKLNAIEIPKIIPEFNAYTINYSQILEKLDLYKKDFYSISKEQRNLYSDFNENDAGEEVMKDVLNILVGPDAKLRQSYLTLFFSEKMKEKNWQGVIEDLIYPLNLLKTEVAEIALDKPKKSLLEQTMKRLNNIYNALAIIVVKTPDILDDNLSENELIKEANKIVRKENLQIVKK